MTWTGQRERGSLLLLRLMFWITLKLGWHVARLLLPPITAWFYATSSAARAASREFLARALGRPVRQADIYRHFYCFACVILDRVFFLAGRGTAYDLRVQGLESVTNVLNSGRGCILLGSHLGSFDVLRAFGRQSPVRVRPVMFRAPGGVLTKLLEALDPELAQDVIEVGAPGAMLRVHESIERGEIVAFLGDRAASLHRTQSADFLGAPAWFPTGPLTLAAVLAAPVILFHGIRVGPRRYQLRFETLAEQITLPRGQRDAALSGWVAAYADRLAAHCRAHPFNWFNFFPFWKTPAPAAPGGAPRGVLADA